MKQNSIKQRSSAPHVAFSRIPSLPIHHLDLTHPARSNIRDPGDSS